MQLLSLVLVVVETIMVAEVEQVVFLLLLAMESLSVIIQ
jgi:hypothetical protein